MMRRVLLALVPVYAFAVYLYGLPLALLTAAVVPTAVVAEFIFERIRAPRGTRAKVTEAVLVTAFLYLLSLPPATPFWVAMIGILFAVIITKGAFGGFGRNIFNPAISGRLFVYIAFPGFMTATFVTAGGFGIDAVTTATTLEAGGTGVPDLLSLFLGIRPGSFGESAVIPILMAAVFLIITKTANWRIILSCLGGAALLSVILWAAGVTVSLPPPQSLLAGSILFVAVFFATDPVSAPKRPAAQLIYGFLIGSTAMVIRLFSLFAEGTSFAVLLGNTFAPLLDIIFKKRTA